ncbi:gephyrin-like molybdotransferase Glp [Ilumatobacter sp.]|uniref:molybdopterin molybdotransferase MoeA n=1 Tax=Ilumatobacter sp. TaxID=1967498 RepID=UPI003B52F8F1
MTPLDDARRLVLASCPAAGAVEVAHRDAIGLVLAQPVVSGEVVPPFDNTAVDGYAVRAADVATAHDDPVDLVVVDEVAAGATSSRTLGRGEAIRIMTGAPMPDGADAVVMVEDSERRGAGADGRELVRLSASVPRGAAIRRAGDDVEVGDVLFAAGTVVTPAVAGVLASVNARVVAVHPRARVAVLSTGDELVDDGSPLERGQIRESNRTMLLGLVAAAGCAAVDLGIVRDDEAELEAVLRHAALDCDAIVSSGGVSMGDYDVVKAVLGRIADMSWMQVAIKPAKPFAFGTLRRDDSTSVPVFGLPGNPVSSLVSFELLARPALRSMMGHRRGSRPRLVAVADEDLRRSTDGKTHFVRVNGSFGGDGRYHVTTVGAQGSHQLAATATADALAVVGDGDGVAAGSDVEVLLLHGDA